MLLTNKLEGIIQSGEKVGLVCVWHSNLHVLQLGREKTWAVVGDIEDCSHPHLLQHREVAGVFGTAQHQVRQDVHRRAVAVRVIISRCRLELQFPRVL